MRTEPPDISVVLPVYNAADTVGACVASMLTQDHPSFEVVLVDDGSADGSANVARGVAAGDPRLRIVSRKHRGLVPALQTGCREARGALIARIDADDTCPPQRLRKQAELLAARPDVDVCSCLAAPPPDQRLRGGYRHYLDWINGLIEPDEIARARFIESPIPHPSVLMRRRALASVGGYRDTGWAEDYDLWLRTIEAGHRVAKVPEVLLYWRDDPERVSRTDPCCSPDAFARCKAHYLRAGPLATVDEAIYWGAGRATRRRSDHLVDLGVRVRAYVDIDPRKIGRRAGGVPVIGPEDLDRYPGLIVLSWVGSRGAREQIRDRLVRSGRREGRDFLLCA